MIKKHKLLPFEMRFKSKSVSEHSSNDQDAVTRDELEQIFAYELRTANSHMSKLKMYSKEIRFSQQRRS